MAYSGRDPKTLLSRIHSTETRIPERDIFLRNTITLTADSNLFRGYGSEMPAAIQVFTNYYPELKATGVLPEILGDIRSFSDATSLDFYLNGVLSLQAEEGIADFPTPASNSLNPEKEQRTAVELALGTYVMIKPLDDLKRDPSTGCYKPL